MNIKSHFEFNGAPTSINYDEQTFLALAACAIDKIHHSPDRPSICIIYSQNIYYAIYRSHCKLNICTSNTENPLPCIILPAISKLSNHVVFNVSRK